MYGRLSGCGQRLQGRSQPLRCGIFGFLIMADQLKDVAYSALALRRDCDNIAEAGQDHRQHKHRFREAQTLTSKLGRQLVQLLVQAFFFAR